MLGSVSLQHMEDVLIMTKENKGTSRGWGEDTMGQARDTSPSSSPVSRHPGQRMSQSRQMAQMFIKKIIHKSYWKLHTCSMVSVHCLAAMALTRPHSLPWGSSLQCPQPPSLTSTRTPPCWACFTEPHPYPRPGLLPCLGSE